MEYAITLRHEVQFNHILDCSNRECIGGILVLNAEHITITNFNANSRYPKDAIGEAPAVDVYWTNGKGSHSIILTESTFLKRCARYRVIDWRAARGIISHNTIENVLPAYESDARFPIRILPYSSFNIGFIMYGNYVYVNRLWGDPETYEGTYRSCVYCEATGGTPDYPTGVIAMNELATPYETYDELKYSWGAAGAHVLEYCNQEFSWGFS